MTRDESVIQVTIRHLTDLMETAASGLVKDQFEASQAMQGCARAIVKRMDEITAQVVEKVSG